MAIAPYELIADRDRAAALLNPLRQRIVVLARSAISAAGLASALKLPRQRVHYHVRLLEEAALLREVGRHRRRGMEERRLQASARGYLLSPELLGPASAHRAWSLPEAGRDRLAALAGLVQAELAAGGGTPADALAALVRFPGEAARDAFVTELGRAVADLIRRYGAPSADRGGAGRERLLLGLYGLCGEGESLP